MRCDIANRIVASGDNYGIKTTPRWEESASRNIRRTL